MLAWGNLMDFFTGLGLTPRVFLRGPDAKAIKLIFLNNIIAKIIRIYFLDFINTLY
jgi:hypothetical protein